MLKRIIGHAPQDVRASDAHWLNVEPLAQVEVTSEDATHPIEAALLQANASGWRALHTPDRRPCIWRLISRSDSSVSI